jgi:pyruvate kinase
MLLNIEKKTKIVCTIGPASDTKEMILKLYNAGMSVMRVNFSHGTYPEQEAKIKIARDFEKEGIYIPCALDTKGPEIRTGYMKDGAVPVKSRTGHAGRHETCLRHRREILGHLYLLI